MSTVRAIYAGLRAVGIADEGDRRDLYERVTGKRSLRLMTSNEQEGVVQELRRLGFRPTAGQRPRAERADVRYLHVLWRLLSDAGETRQPGRSGLNAFIRARFGASWGAEPIDVDGLREPAQINAVTRALKDWCRRAGIPHDHGRD
ncbi:regulatory protein GemA [Paracoccus sanguinis]|uniref:Regulatory protein GemA n=1 Tax=Paracoccus sanguinis TaxID=1545044 RepID=A0A099GFZ3_9RHOB|nr:regulatory protein GemA [Paracoccus sanguinis]KGJ18706.1 hypothetical protein IX57_02995 [Paracoccus sanguinis]KGJ21038.1 hypothetical protein IX55_03710 [Paracoccus sanguinis]KGJ23261.1 hypothetical protein IX56_03095 [Paracoccus sanguinis]SDX43804.1 Protein of unknown function [Paracoccus sanguinis]